MRGQDSGSEHENDPAWTRRESDADGSAAPPMPPPSFGQAPAGEPGAQNEYGTAEHTTAEYGQADAAWTYGYAPAPGYQQTPRHHEAQHHEAQHREAQHPEFQHHEIQRQNLPAPPDGEPRPGDPAGPGDTAPVDDTARFRVPSPADFPQWPPRLPGEPDRSSSASAWPGATAPGAVARPFGAPWPPPVPQQNGQGAGRHGETAPSGPRHAQLPPPDGPAPGPQADEAPATPSAAAAGLPAAPPLGAGPGGPADGADGGVSGVPAPRETPEERSAAPPPRPSHDAPHEAPDQNSLQTPPGPMPATSSPTEPMMAPQQGTPPGMPPGPHAPGLPTPGPPTPGSPAAGSTPLAFTPVTPARAGKPAPPPGFGPASAPPSQAPYGTPGGPGDGRPGTPGPGGGAGPLRKALLTVCSVVAVAAIGTAAYFAYADQPGGSASGGTAGASGAPATNAATPGSDATAFPQQTNASAILDSETTDPRTLTLSETFPAQKVTLDGRTYRRVKVAITEKCDQAAAGIFAKALDQHQCRRVLRATYVDGKRAYAVTTGIAVLPSKEAALAVDQVKDLDSNIWFRGLDGSTASRADRVSISGGYAAGMVWGRYIVFSYATYADGHTPDAKDKVLGPISEAFRDNTAKVIEKRVTG
ncbi:hypothetical protein ACQP1K_04645 [Sphaerimonospora sp. CA-214678]|uniref:hypothetical protein n=1 Tax=Sphaerimonospora sp. CA-214678 TaxID=3240029 RepID=UPI003D90620A